MNGRARDMLKSETIYDAYQETGWFRPLDVARALGVAASTVYKACYAGNIAHRRVGRSVFVHRDSVLEYYKDPELQKILNTKLFAVPKAAKKA